MNDVQKEKIDSIFLYVKSIEEVKRLAESNFKHTYENLKRQGDEIERLKLRVDELSKIGYKVDFIEKDIGKLEKNIKDFMEKIQCDYDSIIKTINKMNQSVSVNSTFSDLFKYGIGAVIASAITWVFAK